MRLLLTGYWRVQELDGEGRDHGLDRERVQRHVGNGQGRYVCFRVILGSYLQMSSTIPQLEKCFDICTLVAVKFHDSSA